MGLYKFGKKIADFTKEDHIKWLEQDIWKLFTMKGLTSKEVKRGTMLIERWKRLTGYEEPIIEAFDEEKSNAFYAKVDYIIFEKNNGL